MYPPTYSGRKVPQQTQKWRFYPWAKGHLYGFSRLPYTAINSFPMQKICGGVTKRIFVQNSKSPQSTNWQKYHHLAKFSPRPQVRKPPTVRTAYHATSGSHRLAKTPPTVQMGLLTGQIFNHASHPASDSHSELESVPTKSKSHQLAEILRPQRIPPGVTPPPSSRRCRAPNGGVEHTNRAKVGLTLSDS